jgi:hypothetical protein
MRVGGYFEWPSWKAPGAELLSKGVQREQHQQALLWGAVKYLYCVMLEKALRFLDTGQEEFLCMGMPSSLSSVAHRMLLRTVIKST